ncbi:MAG TPA: DUF1178 family protein [Rhodocyclaceae bacterium]|nr:DUF1178 family protein [Rhodocyclaceae bacterium]
MIVLNLQCNAGHAFEGWFASSTAFDDQVRAGQLTCPVCGHEQINRLPSGPHVKRSDTLVPVETEVSQSSPASGASVAPSPIDTAKLLQAFASIMDDAEDVSTRFAEEARKIHYGDAEARNIKGKATLEETSELLEEGIAVLPVPIPDKDSMH